MIFWRENEILTSQKGTGKNFVHLQLAKKCRSRGNYNRLNDEQMATAVTNEQRIGKALVILNEALRPFLEEVSSSSICSISFLLSRFMLELPSLFLSFLLSTKNFFIYSIFHLNLLPHLIFSLPSNFQD